MIDTTTTLNKLADLEERAIFKAGPALKQAEQILEGRRRIAWAAAWLVLARDSEDTHAFRRTMASVGLDLRRVQQALDREMGHE